MLLFCLIMIVLDYRCQKLIYEDVLCLLTKAENSFTPSLSQNIPYTLEEYAKKLSENASFVVVEDNEEAIGFVAYYTNIEGGFVYIPQIWVSDFYQRKGVGSSMVDMLISNVPSIIRSIRLEVRKNNEKALSFYVKNQYVVIDEKGDKYLMEKLIVKN